VQELYNKFFAQSKIKLI
jgi:hypothetical protein